MATDNSATQGLRLPWAGKKVRQELVENELTSLWHLAADNMRISQNMNVRTSVLNFVICAQDSESAHQASILLRELSSIHIARVTLLILDTRSDQSDDVSTWVTLRSFPIISDIMRHNFEQITVTLSGTVVRHAANVVQQLLKPDLPVYLWWLNDLPTTSSTFQQFISISSRIIVDSRDFSQPEERIRTLSSFLQQNPDCALSDLNWGRLTAWRELIAQFFDVAEYRPYLVGINRIEIEHAVPPASATQPGQNIPNPIGALLLAAWMKTRLGWYLSPTSEHNYHDAKTGSHSWYMVSRNATRILSQPLNENQPNGKSESPAQEGIHITVRPREQADSTPGTICLIRATGTSAGKQATFSIERSGDDDHAQTSVVLPDSTRPQHTVNLAAAHKESNLLHNELEITGRDHLYEETLYEVFELLG